MYNEHHQGEGREVVCVYPRLREKDSKDSEETGPGGKGRGNMTQCGLIPSEKRKRRGKLLITDGCMVERQLSDTQEPSGGCWGETTSLMSSWGPLGAGRLDSAKRS